MNDGSVSLGKSRRFGRIQYLFDLAYELVKRDIKLRYKGSLIGLGWSLLNPLATLAVFASVFSLLLPLNIPNFAVFLYTGILAWTWFQSSWVAGTTSIVDGRELIRQPGFPPSILPIISLLSNLVHFILALPILLIFLLISDIGLPLTILYLPIVLLVQLLMTACLSYFTAAVHVSFRDTSHLVNIFTLLLFYLSAIFYDVATLPVEVQPWFRLNPIIHLLDAYRAILIDGQPPNLLALLVLALLSTAALWLSQRYFVRMSYRFVEEL